MVLTSQTFIDMVDRERAINWQNSDIWREGEKMLEVVADHLKVCENCRMLFDDMYYKATTLIEWINETNFDNTAIEDWVCTEDI